MFRPCTNIIEGDICVLDDTVCHLDCPLFEDVNEQIQWAQDDSYRFWDHYINAAMSSGSGSDKS